MNPLLAFDLDGTLIDSAPDIIRAVNRTLKLYNKPVQTDEVVIAHIGEGLRKLIADLFQSEKLTDPEIDEVQKNFLKIYEEEMVEETSIFPGAEDFLANYTGPIAIITNKNEAPAKRIIKHLGLHRYPWVNVFGADTLAEKKPSPLPLQAMMKLAQRDPASTIMIGDGIPDMVSAQRAGVASIAIGFGYTQVEILKKYEPRAVLGHYSELSSLLTHFYQKKQPGPG